MVEREMRTPRRTFYVFLGSGLASWILLAIMTGQVLLSFVFVPMFLMVHVVGLEVIRYDDRGISVKHGFGRWRSMAWKDMGSVTVVSPGRGSRTVRFRDGSGSREFQVTLRMNLSDGDRAELSKVILDRTAHAKHLL